MAYSERLAEKIRGALDSRFDVEEKKMFGGLCFMVAGSMACGVMGDDLLARVGPAAYDDALAQPHAHVMDFTGRPLRGFVRVAGAGLRTSAVLGRWVRDSVAFAVLQADSKPAKRPKQSKISQKPALRKK